MTPEITVIEIPTRNTKALFVNDDLVVWADPQQDDPIYLVDEAAEHLAGVHRVSINYLTCELPDL
ncbi:MAG: hypothetical protein OQJ91_04025 [Motiliproteus sp.]|nr:hypothetical protein [Motiliproteus sp.]